MWYLSSESRLRADVRRIFAEFDNGTGQVDLDDIRHVLEALAGPSLSRVRTLVSRVSPLRRRGGGSSVQCRESRKASKALGGLYRYAFFSLNLFGNNRSNIADVEAALAQFTQAQPNKMDGSEAQGGVGCVEQTLERRRPQRAFSQRPLNRGQIKRETAVEAARPEIICFWSVSKNEKHIQAHCSYKAFQRWYETSAL